MDIAAYVALALGGLVLAFAGLHGFENKSITIISFGIGATLEIIAVCLYWQDAVWKKPRAWVAPIAFAGEPKANEPFTAWVRYKNTGKVAAKHVRVTFFAYDLRKGLKPDFSIVEKEPAEGGADSILQPDGELSSSHTHNNGKALTLNEVKQVESGEVVVFAFGRICYVDNTPHWTKFCVFFDPKLKRYSSYDEYNDVGDHQCP
jgi:hypothetical protein